MQMTWASESVEVYNDVCNTLGKPVSVLVRFAVGEGDGAIKHAWVEIEVQTNHNVNADLDPEVLVIKKKVSGLSYEEKTHQVFFKPDVSAKPIACGELIEGNFFTTTRVKSNGACSFVTKFDQRAVDDGYNVRKKPHLLVDMIY
jgi:hypothetical protein